MGPALTPIKVVGRYAIFQEIASGGMAAVHLGRLLGAAGFSRTVAIKALHENLAEQREFVEMLLDEARLASRIRHPNVVPVIDVVAEGNVYIVMEYVPGESLARLARAARSRDQPIPAAIACGVVAGTLSGLAAAHEATSERGEKLEIIHRDVSPQNVLVGTDGLAHLIDFGVAKAAGRLQTTHTGQLKGKLPYIAPEQTRGGPVTTAVDVYAASVVLWELLAGRRLFTGDTDVAILERVMFELVPPPSAIAAGVPPELDGIVLKGLSRDPAARFRSAREMARAIEEATALAPPSRVGEWVAQLASDALADRRRRVTEIEASFEARGGEQVKAVLDSLGTERPSVDTGVDLLPDGEPSTEPALFTEAAPTTVSAPLRDADREPITTVGSEPSGVGVAIVSAPSR